MKKVNKMNNPPTEIPTKKPPHTDNPIKDPAIPSKNNPGNPKEDNPPTTAKK